LAETAVIGWVDAGVGGTEISGRGAAAFRPPSRRCRQWGGSEGSASGRSVGGSALGGFLFDLLDDVFVGFLPDRLHQVFLGVFVGGGVEGDFLGLSGVSSSDDDVGDSFQLGERLTDVLFTAVSRDACHGDRIHGLGGGLSRADPCEEGQRGECHSECFHGFVWITVGIPHESARSVSTGVGIRQSGNRLIRGRREMAGAAADFVVCQFRDDRFRPLDSRFGGGMLPAGDGGGGVVAADDGS